jgi:polyphosphate kinase
VPVEDEQAKADLLDVIERSLADDSNAWDLGDDGTWVRRTPGSEPRSVQREMMIGHNARAAEAA